MCQQQKKNESGVSVLGVVLIVAFCLFITGNCDGKKPSQPTTVIETKPTQKSEPKP